MTLKGLIERLRDMEVIYDNAVIVVSDENGQRMHIASIDGFWGEKRPGECRDLHVININVKK